MQQPLSSLSLPKYILQELNSKGYNNCKDFLEADEKVKQKFPEVEKLLETPNTKSALDVYQDECLLGYIPTLIKPVDEALYGGIPVGLITEITGDVDTSKTELWYFTTTNINISF